MKNFLINIFKLLFSFALILFSEKYYFKLLNILGFNIKTYSSTVISLVNLLFYIIILILIYFLYRSDIQDSISRFKRKTFNNFGQSIFYFIVVLIIIIITNYLCKVLGNSFHLDYHEIDFVNVFNKALSFELVIEFIQNIFIIPLIKVSIFILGVYNLIPNNKASSIVSGLLYAVYCGYAMNGPIGNIIINLVPSFVLFTALASFNQKNSHITFSMLTYIFYELFSGLIIARLW